MAVPNTNAAILLVIRLVVSCSRSQPVSLRRSLSRLKVPGLDIALTGFASSLRWGFHQFLLLLRGRAGEPGATWSELAREPHQPLDHER